MPTKSEIVNGAELISRAAMDAGVNFFAGYPITPASSIYTTMLRKLQGEGKVAIGASDEISGLAMCIGASMRGAKSMTATSAPGLALMVESIGYAFATETPVLITLGQRLGPSTGAATQSAEGDISFVQNLISGGFQIPVIAPNSIFNCYETTFQAINISEQYRTPVILLTEKDIIMSSTNILVDELEQVKSKLTITNRPSRGPNDDKPFKTYDFNTLSEIPKFLATGLGSNDRVVATGSIHDKAGQLLKNSPEAIEVVKHLSAKIEEHVDDISLYQLDEEPGARTTVISFLASDLSAREAIIEARKQGHKINHLTLHTLFPIPAKAISQAVANVDTVVIPEINLSGQYADIIQHLLVNSSGQKLELRKVNSLADLIKPELISKTVTARQ